MSEPISIISLWQPWAQWVMFGWKTIETRRHERFRGLWQRRIGIHAAKKWDDDALGMAAVYLTPEQIALTEAGRRHWPRGKLLGTVFVSEERWCWPVDAKRALIECDTPRHGLVLFAPQILETPIEMRGGRGIWRYRL